MRRLSLGIVVLIATIGQAQAKGMPFDLNDEQLMAIQEKVKTKLNNPYSVMFKGVVAREADGWIMTCGWVNARSAARDYIGYVPFSAALKRATGEVFSDTPLQNEYLNKLTLEACRYLGLELSR